MFWIFLIRNSVFTPRSSYTTTMSRDDFWKGAHRPTLEAVHISKLEGIGASDVTCRTTLNPGIGRPRGGVLSARVGPSELYKRPMCYGVSGPTRKGVGLGPHHTSSVKRNGPTLHRTCASRTRPCRRKLKYYSL
jgi:hypothetical protein